jgi:hypothetical protein
MARELKTTGFVLSYNNDPYKSTRFEVKEGDRIEWKRNGSTGSVKAKIVGFDEKKPGYVFVENFKYDWSGPYESRSKVWIRINSVLRVKTS